MAIQKEFVLTHVFKDVPNMIESKYYYSDPEEYFNAPWKMSAVRKNGSLGVYFYCTKSVKDPKWTVQTEFEVKLINAEGKHETKKTEQTFKNEGEAHTCWGWPEIIKWKDMVKNYMIDDNLTVELHVIIKEMKGFANDKLLKFDETMNEFSDVVLIVNEEKFFVSKMFLAYQSSYFKSLLFGNFEEANQAEVKLDDVDTEDFQKFLEVIYGRSAIDDNNVEGILVLADMWDAQSVIKRCEEFLILESKLMLKVKLQISTCYKLDNLKKKCLSEINTAAEIRSILPDDLTKLDSTIAADLLKNLVNANETEVQKPQVISGNSSILTRIREITLPNLPNFRPIIPYVSSCFMWLTLFFIILFTGVMIFTFV